MGVDRGIHVVLNDKEYEGLQPLAVAKLFQKITEQENPNLILLGKQVMISQKLLIRSNCERIRPIDLTSLLKETFVEMLTHCIYTSTRAVIKGCNPSHLSWLSTLAVMGDQSGKLKVARETINFCKTLRVNLHLLQQVKNLMCQSPLITSFGEPLTCQGSKLATNWSHMRLDFWLCA